MAKYDYLIVGSGLAGAISARELTNAGKKCLVIEQREHIGGNCYTENINGINVHKYGPHIFHTSNKHVWDYMNKYVTFNHYVNRPKVSYDGKLYSFPINLMTLYQIFGVTTPDQAQWWMERNEIQKIENPKNLEEWIISQVGVKIYEMFVKGYTEKQWGRKCNELPASIIKRLPIRYTFDDNYFTDKYQGIPIGGYTQIFDKLLDGIEVKLKTDYFLNKEHFDDIAHNVIYTGPVDKFYDYRFGKLDYRSLEFKHLELKKQDYQGNAIFNFTNKDVPYTRINEHKHFEFTSEAFEKPFTIVTKEFPTEYVEGENIPYYPINDDKNKETYNKYKSLVSLEKKFIFMGRLAEYKYYDMHHVVAVTLDKINSLLKM